MCGITVAWHLDGTPVERGWMRRFTDSIEHRGPDGSGAWYDDVAGLALGHRRLSILDPSDAGSQPMASADGRLVIVYNGEVFNFLELRRELAGLGVRFRSDTDTEVILEAYRHWGPDCQLRFNGMWAFAIWDRERRELFVSRDRFGIKPCHVGRFGRDLYVSSELRSFMRLDRHATSVDEDNFRRELLSSSLNEGVGATLLRGVRSLRGGHCLLVGPDGEREWQWWDTLEHLPEAPTDPREQAEALRSLLVDAARIRLRSDARLATSLSGGLDSSSVLGALRAAADADESHEREADWHHAFVASFPGTPSDEDRFARMAADAVGATAEFVALDLDDLQERMEDLALRCEVVIPTFIGPVWAIYRAMADRGIKVSLDGHGGDELFAGYESYVTAAMLAPGVSLARRRELVETMARMRQPGDPGLAQQARIAVANHPKLRRASLGIRGRLRRLRQPNAVGSHWLRREDDLDLEPVRLRDDLPPVTAVLHRDFHVTSLPAILRNFDRASMANGVEVRMPLMDWRIVTLAFALPDEAKIAGGHTKHVLREAVRGLVPEPVRTRRWKVGFGSPLAAWFTGPLEPWVRDAVNDPDFLDSDVWNGPMIRDRVHELSAGRAWAPAEAGLVWLYLSAHLWRRQLESG